MRNEDLKKNILRHKRTKRQNNKRAERHKDSSGSYILPHSFFFPSLVQNWVVSSYLNTSFCLYSHTIGRDVFILGCFNAMHHKGSATISSTSPYFIALFSGCWNIDDNLVGQLTIKRNSTELWRKKLEKSTYHSW